uniref:Uncharacterized protein n=1 Tax=Arundo donax TaxID=35708 RepID=A0A0A8YBF2_ARUDO
MMMGEMGEAVEVGLEVREGALVEAMAMAMAEVEESMAVVRVAKE